ncbi:Holliday junction DNA helicase RuvA [Candidatus Nomurabacteria bacterium RIFCSPHIGHO2_01_FULL_39_220]|uniref:Holliday junction branch migration complex subunit RuvA n=1 Tax=Candidatus Nomurabacteria bacterium RIFCSPLOWO2_02_FULL_40_67 TaxID=1801787 RepID=A0A1F6Y2E6_9BACT|nr:MAG: Holliday junction ATP-dependent DNA helicase RuvA [Parcubacteria group bacterium GW2011_GWA2_40_37]KKS11811.1 MAG: Holliday junction ATP-dependent DNA helicase RuvA [Parcubacteria group bacterium GW2011_GWB1_41_5]KKS73285.1 MAG: Holliday junction ATP-dependent DNA helicase RuvA [Parcubacteria group bacterium GW2011_GWF2_42_7]OGI62375.1 MAG: Holliday junction DNA helicase RuvA [Candidatus Nomurabacteria bacterium RBG_16_40_11]OGI70734.1 MAG: Holliday junction DNA helicase RuvA [Candidatu
MIGHLKGNLIYQDLKSAIVDIGGVGYKVGISADALIQRKKVGDEISLWIHTHVREDCLDLYGFASREELEFFEMLISVSRIGPKGAIGILTAASTETLRKAISASDISYLTKISGIGRKTAEKIVIELRDKIANGISENQDSFLQAELDAMEALKSFGYSQNEVREALKKVTPNANINTKIREALKTLGEK